MKYRKIALALAALVCVAGSAVAQDDAKIWYSWSPKPVPLTPWAAPNKPIWRLNEILAAHKGQADWVQPIVRDQDYHADYISMGAGQKTKPQFWADDRIFWYIASGQVRFHIQGQEPIVAGKGFLVQVPYRNIYWMETVGDEPSVRFEVVRNNRTPLYPTTQNDAGAAPTAKGKTYVLASYRTPPDPYTDKNKPYLDFWGDFVKRPATPGDHAFVADTTNFMNVIRGHGVPTPPDSNKGHFHIDYNEFWVIAEGTVDYKMEGMKVFTASVGDVVLAPQGRWHRASWAGNGMSTRIAINPRPFGMHNFDPDSGAKPVKHFLLAAVVLMPLPALAQPAPAPTKLFTSGTDIPALIAQAKANQKSPTVNSVVPIAVVGPYRVLLEYRTGLTPPTVHHGQVELIHVIQGGATLVTGGKLTGVQPSRPGTLNESGTGIEGASPQKLTAGDYVVVPADTAHQFQDVQGEFIIMSVHMFMPDAK